MKLILNTLILIFTFLWSSAQEITTTYHKKDDSQTDAVTTSHYYRNIYKDTLINNIQIYKLEEYYSASDQPKRITYISNLNPKSFKFFYEKYEYYENGKLESLLKYNITGNPIDSAFYCYPNGTIKLVTYRNPKRDNIVSDKSIEYVAFFDEQQNILLKEGNGTMRFPIQGNSKNTEEGEMKNHNKHGLWQGTQNGFPYEDLYENGKLIKGEITLADGKKVKYDAKTFRIQPEYPGGMDELIEYIRKNYKYPAEAVQAKVAGTVQVKFVVNKEGNIRDIQVTKDLGFGTGDAAIQLVQSFGKWKPGTQRGLPQNVSYTLPIRLQTN